MYPNQQLVSLPWHVVHTVVSFVPLRLDLLGCEIKARMFFPKNFLVILTYKILAKNQHSVFAPATWHGGIVTAYVIESYGP
jgi:hypothetical protein